MNAHRSTSSSTPVLQWSDYYLRNIYTWCVTRRSVCCFLAPSVLPKEFTGTSDEQINTTFFKLKEIRKVQWQENYTNVTSCQQDGSLQKHEDSRTGSSQQQQSQWSLTPSQISSDGSSCAHTSWPCRTAHIWLFSLLIRQGASCFQPPFQWATIAPQINLTGYDAATAQSLGSIPALGNLTGYILFSSQPAVPLISCLTCT